MYTKKFLEGSQILSQVMGERKELAKDLRYRVVLYTDDPDKLENIEILSVKDMTLKEFLIWVTRYLKQTTRGNQYIGMS